MKNPIGDPIEVPIEIPTETVEQLKRRKAIQLSTDRSNRMRALAEANRARKAVSPPAAPSLLSVCSSLPAHALPIHNSGLATPPRLNRGVINNPKPTLSRGPITHANAVRRDYDLFEFACSDNSRIGIEGPLLGVNICRLTFKTCNLTTRDGFRTALAFVRANPGASVHSSIPCTP